MTEYQLIPSDYFGKENLLLYSGQFSLQEESDLSSIEVDGEICMVLGANFELIFRGVIISDYSSRLKNITKCKIFTPTGFFGQAFAGKRTFGNVHKVEGVINKFSANENKGEIDKYIIHVANFDYLHHGSWVRFEDTISASHVSIEIDDWIIGLQNGYNQKTKEAVKISEEKWNYGLTHIIEIQKKENKTFKMDDALSLLDSINAGLSFSSGRKVGFPIHTGFLRNNQVFEQYWHVYMDVYKDKSTWFPEYRSMILSELLPLLHKKFEDSYMKKAIIRSIHLYSEANQTTFVGQPVVYTQVALETVWWVILTQLEESSMTQKQYEDMRQAFKRMQEMAEVLKINAELPSFENFTLEGSRISDFPVLFTRYRNHLSHPSPNPIFETIVGIDEWEIANWGLWYLEMGLLYIIGYDGEYADRRKIPRAAGTYEYVPWSRTKNNNLRPIE